MNVFSVILVLFYSRYWLILTGFVSLNLRVFSLAGFCPSAAFINPAGVKSRLGRT
jgi:hypothetical protein